MGNSSRFVVTGEVLAGVRTLVADSRDDRAEAGNSLAGGLRETSTVVQGAKGNQHGGVMATRGDCNKHVAV